ncbi:addiction module toxin, HicA family [Candidatus Adlerbacteria bacterium RIFCSPHIGHO2_02_FULL_54_18]|uniref:Addiction module toxin, HicA family n=2 Tax=Candidatus Adleribacteriota TaxID=1752736 RepID=A0A1F4Y1Q5_9BACT|nr:MAG: addiction module toxin, HicA family [Candidatus Adlerbacteria bacterium RIFCSPLOWO2_01_FULL_54_21b]OGC87879.1 MAG: addiction module toxin, HicA family [Candidatus Adlerbacteria bacterium RIFCSPHIGHO2_02_FULL_54_18]
MKRRDLVRHIEQHGCVLSREGAKHSIYKNPQSEEWASVARHAEIWPKMARKICKQLDIPAPRKR